MILALFPLAITVHSHSWLECTMYTGDTDYFEKDKCLGLPRPLPGNRNVGGTFGADIGMDFRPQAGGARCQGSATAGTAANYPGGMVTYETGTTYRLAWAPKNHAAATCSNAFIPDTFLKLYMTPYNQAAGDPDQATFRQNQVPASFSDDPHVNGQIDFKGFQNCPKFCEDTDKSLCTGTFSVPEGTAPGVYTFQWYWAFNGEADLYSTCWEANVATGTGGTGTGGIPTETGAPEPTTPVGVVPTTTSQPTTVPPDCVASSDCCLAGQTIAPGTGVTVDYDVLRNVESKTFDCPENYDGTFKLMCINSQARHVDGFCATSSRLLSGDGEEGHSDGTVAGLSVALALTIIAFAAYVAITRGWVEACQEDSQQKPDLMKMNNIAEPVHQKRRANSVLTTSNTELPRLPESPFKSNVQWHYVNADQQSVGPVSEKDLVFYCRGLPNHVARDTLVWNENMTEWKPVHACPTLNYP